MHLTERLGTRGGAIALALLCLTTGCDGRISVVTGDPGNPSLGGLIGPRVLQGEVRGGVACFYAINQDGSVVGLLLPAGWGAQAGATLDVIDEAGRVAARTGGTYWIGGGYLPEVPDKLLACAPDRVWLVGDFLLEDPTE